MSKQVNAHSESYKIKILAPLFKLQVTTDVHKIDNITYMGKWFWFLGVVTSMQRQQTTIYFLLCKSLA